MDDVLGDREASLGETPTSTSGQFTRPASPTLRTCGGFTYLDMPHGPNDQAR